MTNPTDAANRFSIMKRLFDHLLELETRRRPEELEKLAAEHTTTVAELRDLLAAVDPEDLTVPVEPATEGRRIGPFALVRALGRGGMGEVYFAERVDGGFEQQVAIKLASQVRFGSELHFHFFRERQLLARLDHPHIAHLIDGGLTDAGQPWLAMEYINGSTLMHHARARRLDLTMRLRLWLKVAEAAEFAHRNLIVHGDLKPANVMVTADGIPKLIDFGVAGLLSAEPAAGVRQHGYTLRYAAPEQIAGKAITTAADVYGLGMMLFELLSGVPAFSKESESELRQAIQTSEPPSLRSAARTMADDPEAPDHRHQHRRSAYGRQLDTFGPELDAILHRALHKDPAARYPSAAAFADDVDRLLCGRTVAAMKQTLRYRARKFVGQHQAAVIGTAAFVLASIGGIGSVAWQARIAQGRAKELEQVTRFQAEMLGQVDPARLGEILRDDEKRMLAAALSKADLPPDERAAELQSIDSLWRRVNATDAARHLIDSAILSPAVAAVDAQFKDQPAVDAALRQVLADRYVQFGLYDAALPLQVRALDTRRGVLGESHPDTLASTATMGALLQNQGKLAEAEAYYQAALAGRRKELGELHPATLSSINDLGYLRNRQGRFDEALTLYREALGKSGDVNGREHPDTLAYMHNIADVLKQSGRLSEAEPYLRRVLEAKRRTLGRDHPDTLVSLNNLSRLMLDKGDLHEAEQLARETIDGCRRTFGADHPKTLFAIYNLGLVLDYEERFDEAEPLIRDALEKRRHLLGNDHPDTWATVQLLGESLLSQEKLAEAHRAAEEVLESRRRGLGNDNPSTLHSLRLMGSVLVAEGRFAEAVALLAPAEVATREAFKRRTTIRVPLFLVALGRARAGAGAFADAERALLEAHAAFEQSKERRPGDMRDATRALVDLYVRWQKSEPDAERAATAAVWQARLESLANQGSN